MPFLLAVTMLAVAAAAAGFDLLYRRIPNWLNLSGLILGLGFSSYLFGTHGLFTSLLGMLCALAVYVPLYLLKGMGAGDVKLMATIGSIAGPHNWILIFLITAILGGVASIVAVLRKRRLHQTVSNVAVITSELMHFRAPSTADARLDIHNKDALRLPHGAVIAGGSALFLILSRVVMI